MLKRPLKAFCRPSIAIPNRVPGHLAHLQRRFYAEQQQSPKETGPPKWEINLKEWREIARTTSKARISSWTTAAGENFTLLAKKLNELTGYELIEQLKKEVVEQEARIESARKAAREAKVAYEASVSERSKYQRESHDLLQRKSSWSESDVVRFTDLVRQDHLNEQAEAKAKLLVATTDEAIEQEFQSLTRAILNRYHEEQVWSDKIRSASTYGSLLALGLNVVVFVLAIIVVEPYKRKRMAETFEKRIEQLSRETKEMVETISSHVDDHLLKQESILVPLTTPHAASGDEPVAIGELSSVAYIVTIPVERREMVSAAIGAAATLTFVGLVSIFRR